MLNFVNRIHFYYYSSYSFFELHLIIYREINSILYIDKLKNRKNIASILNKDSIKPNIQNTKTEAKVA